MLGVGRGATPRKPMTPIGALRSRNARGAPRRRPDLGGPDLAGSPGDWARGSMRVGQVILGRPFILPPDTRGVGEGVCAFLTDDPSHARAQRSLRSRTARRLRLLGVRSVVHVVLVNNFLLPPDQAGPTKKSSACAGKSSGVAHLGGLRISFLQYNFRG